VAYPPDPGSLSFDTESAARTLARARQLEARGRADTHQSHAAGQPPRAFSDEDVNAIPQDEENRLDLADDLDDDNVDLTIDGADDDDGDRDQYHDEFTDNESDVFGDGDGDHMDSYSLHTHVRTSSHDTSRR
jgi:hypothetical protein